MATLTVYPSSGTAVQGTVLKADSSDWATTRGATDGQTTDVEPDTTAFLYCLGPTPTNYRIKRSFFLFDTSALTSGATITGAVISFAGTGAAEFTADDDYIHVVSSNPASNTALANADYDQVGTTSFGSLQVSTWNQTSGTYNDITLNASGIANISKTGISKFGVRSGRDLNNNAPTGTNQCYCQLENTDKPKLVITYTVPAGPASVKTVNGLAKASVKTVNNLAIASVKSINGLT